MGWIAVGLETIRHQVAEESTTTLVVSVQSRSQGGGLETHTFVEQCTPTQLASTLPTMASHRAPATTWWGYTIE